MLLSLEAARYSVSPLQHHLPPPPAKNNSATRGGVFFGQDDTNSTIDYSTCTGNSADNGGVVRSCFVWLVVAAKPSQPPHSLTCVCAGSQVYLLGDVTNGGRPFLLASEVSFSENKAQFGAVQFGAVATFTDVQECSFKHNRATASGGVMYMSGTPPSRLALSVAWCLVANCRLACCCAGASTLNMENIQAVDNSAKFDGGIMYTADSSALRV